MGIKEEETIMTKATQDTCCLTIFLHVNHELLLCLCEKDFLFLFWYEKYVVLSVIQRIFK